MGGLRYVVLYNTVLAHRQHAHVNTECALVCYVPPLTCTSYRQYWPMDSMRMSGLNFSMRISRTFCVVAELDTRTHFVTTFCPSSWLKKRITPWNSKLCQGNTAKNRNQSIMIINQSYVFR